MAFFAFWFSRYNVARETFFAIERFMKKHFVAIAIFITWCGIPMLSQAAPKPPPRSTAPASTRAAEINYGRHLETLSSGLDKSLANLYVAWERAIENRKAVEKLGSNLPIDKSRLQTLANVQSAVRAQLRQMNAMPTPPLAFRRVSRDLEPARQDVSRSIALIDIWRAAPSDMMEHRMERLLRRGSSNFDDAFIEAKTIAARLGKKP